MELRPERTLQAPLPRSAYITWHHHTDPDAIIFTLVGLPVFHCAWRPEAFDLTRIAEVAHENDKDTDNFLNIVEV
jgi:hypothetical protein